LSGEEPVIEIAELRHSVDGALHRLSAVAPAGELGGKTAPGVSGSGKKGKGAVAGEHDLGFGFQGIDFPRREISARPDAAERGCFRVENKRGAVGEKDANRLSAGSL
jgi:hypothetical protein